MTFVNRKLYRQKPKQYGPIPVVKKNIFKRAERYGIDPASFETVLLFWEKAGIPKSIIGKDPTVIDTASKNAWVNDAYYIGGVDAGPSYSSLNTNNNALSARNFSLFTVFNVSAVSGAGVIMRSANDNTIPVWRNSGFDTRLYSVDYAAAGTFNLNQEYKYSITGTSTQAIINVDGKRVLTGGAPGNGTFSGGINIGTDSNGGGVSNIYLKLLILFNKAQKAENLLFLSDNPYYLIQREAPIFYSIPASGGSSLLPINETAHGDDSISVSVSLALSETGSGADDFSGMAASVPVSDTSSAVDAVSQILNSLLVQDISSAVDSIAQVLAGLAINDAGAGSDTLSLFTEILKTITDTGAGSDTISSPLVTLSISDSGIASDLINAIAAALSISDSGSASDLINTIQTQLIQVSESGSGSDSVSMAVSLTVSDIASALDAVGQILNSLTITDSLSGLDSVIKTDLDLLPKGMVKITFSIKIPGANFNVKVPGVDFTIN